MADEKERGTAGFGAQLETAARSEAIDPLPGCERADDRPESAGRGGFLQRPEQLFLLRGRNHQQTVRRDAEISKPVPVKLTVFLCLTSQTAITEALACRCFLRHAQSKGQGYGLMTGRGRKQLMKPRRQHGFRRNACRTGGGACVHGRQTRCHSCFYP